MHKKYLFDIDGHTNDFEKSQLGTGLYIESSVDWRFLFTGLVLLFTHLTVVKVYFVNHSLVLSENYEY